MKTNERVFNEAKSSNMFDKLRLLFHKRVKTSRSQQEKIEFCSHSVIKEIQINGDRNADKGDSKNKQAKKVDLNDTLEFNIDEFNADDADDLLKLKEFDKMITSDLLSCAEFPIPSILPRMIGDEKKETADDNSGLEKDETQGLPTFVITDSDRISEMDRMFKYKTSTCYESLKMRVDKADIVNGKRAFRFKDTDCMLSIDEETPAFISDYEEEVNVVFTRPDKYIHTKSEPREYPCECKAILDNTTIELFKKYKKEEELVEAARIFNRLTPKQQAYIRNQSSKPVIKDVEVSRSEDEFTPIQDQDSLEMMYKICRNTYSAETRARLDILISKLHSHHFSGETKADIVTQLSYALCIDTDALQHKQKTYDEIIETFNKYVYGMTDLKERIAEYILAMQYSGANYFCILLVGSPGVGKTSVCEAISEILDCELAHVDCSGVDTIGLCGLVKSYGGAQPSKISNVLIGKGKADLLLRLDEIDKLVKDKNGDAYSALIKPFGPQRAFHDEFLDGDIDMSNTKIVCTANDINKIPGYILNRFGDNIFYIPDYNTKDKAEIAKHYIISRKLEEYKIKENELVFTDEAIYEVAANYCVDSGAREITAYIESLIRKAIKGWSRGTDPKPLLIDVEHVRRNLRHNDNGKPRKQIGFTG